MVIRKEFSIQMLKISHKIAQKCAIFHIKIFSDITTAELLKTVGYNI